jgi:hypothetical protein
VAQIVVSDLDSVVVSSLSSSSSESSASRGSPKPSSDKLWQLGIEEKVSTCCEFPFRADDSAGGKNCPADPSSDSSSSFVDKLRESNFL